MIIIAAYKTTWPQEFLAIRASLTEILGGLALRIDHIGSTSVPGLGAKDIIDIQITVRALEPGLITHLTGAGYQHCSHISGDHVPLGEDDNPALWVKYLFKQPRGMRPVNIHVRIKDNPNQRYALLFRDYLRAHPNSVRTVELIKRELARRDPEDLDAYYDIKDPVYDLIWDAAQEWSETTGWQQQVLS